MKGDARVIETLNSLLARELTVVSQYIVHAELCESWGYEKLHDQIRKRAIVEMNHAEKLIGRILFLEGTPVVSNLERVNIGSDVVKMFENDHEVELDAVRRYNSGIVTCTDVGDYATRELLQRILDDEDKHVDSIEEVRNQISQMGIRVFLASRL